MLRTLTERNAEAFVLTMSALAQEGPGLNAESFRPVKMVVNRELSGEKLFDAAETFLSLTAAQDSQPAEVKALATRLLALTIKEREVYQHMPGPR